MRRVKMFMSCVVALALLCFFSAPMVQAQVLEDTVHEVKISASAVSLEPGFVFSKTGGKVAGPVVLRNPVANGTGGFDYQIRLLIDMGPGDCNEANIIGTLSTYGAAENVAFGRLDIIGLDIPEPGLSLSGEFFAQVKTTPGKTSFKSVAGWAEVVVDGAPGPDPDGITKKFKAMAKEKTSEKQGLSCTVP